MRKYLSFPEILIFLPILAFSLLLMFKTFQISPDGNLKIATKAWSDFAATIPLIRSFSLGDNFPPEYPLFAGPPIRYHFLFFLFVGFLERIGLRLDWALNIPSAISFFLLTLVIYFLGVKVFKKKSIGILSVVLFLFNGSFSFLEFLKTHPISPNFVNEITKATQFASFGPYDGKIVSAFWSLNIFTNQRHLALAYAAFLLLVFFLYRFTDVNKKFSIKVVVLLSLLIGLFPFIHLAVFGMMLIALGVFFLLYPKARYQIFLIGLFSLAIALPQILYMGKSQITVKFFDPGYLVQNLNLVNFIKYWVLNLGLGVFLAPIGFALVPKKIKKIFFPFLTLFVVGNLFRFSPEVAANHKFFNLFLIGANFFTAFALVSIWDKKIVGKVLVASSIFLLTFSGIIDIFPILNDGYIEISDYRKNQTSQFIIRNSTKDSLILNSSYLYDPASLAGRKIYLGWPYFSWSAGYDTDTRFQMLRSILEAKDKKTACALLTQEGIDYIETSEPTSLEGVQANYSLFEKNFEKIFIDPRLKLNIYDVKVSCVKN
ncbi:hypothetical protein A3E15_01035 [Candidatus Woesebacteria bacterium RIFCSPHIGHO2_12_FULL_42_9]|uniref:Glycosyltransferase RgtA/B/C/D-like domain-containing protein n=2 Tax=Candidatus Woeseibacteriota TaxID=1752722 RepID=A0A1F8AXL4_9BACT|nr:MAG: hypothetical protein A2129_02140 [Candidatus Woesebacteria bacterium GWC1_42_13]OGM56466.1 MAG: hypothetical protein A3E15_01035 [Candidatus Woesebacteria bacterium RIFCSPHIGHO2_12_FULL_42_9]